MASRDYEALSQQDPPKWDDLEAHYRTEKSETGFWDSVASWFTGTDANATSSEFPPTNTHKDITPEQGAFLKKALTNWLKGTSGGVTYSDLSGDLKDAFKERIKELGIKDDSESYKLLIAGFNKETFATKETKQPFYLDAVFKPIYILKNNRYSDEIFSGTLAYVRRRWRRRPRSGGYFALVL